MSVVKKFLDANKIAYSQQDETYTALLKSDLGHFYAYKIQEKASFIYFSAAVQDQIVDSEISNAVTLVNEINCETSFGSIEIDIKSKTFLARTIVVSIEDAGNFTSSTVTAHFYIPLFILDHHYDRLSKLFSRK